MAYTVEEEADGEILIRKPEEKRPLWRPRCSWKYSIKMNLEEI
jgi:hypothetical protein